MGFSFDGRVLRPPRVAPTNAKTTGEPVTGVIRDARVVPPVYDLSAQSPEFVDARADQYRAAILEAPGTAPVEYLVWAANTAQLAVADDPDWWTEEGTGSIPLGELVVTDASPAPIVPGEPVPAGYGYFFDGSDSLIVQDDSARSIGSIVAVVISRGDVDDYDDDGWVDEDNLASGRAGTKPYMVLLPTSTDQDPDAGIVRLTRTGFTPQGSGDQVLTALGGGLSEDRGDRIQEVRYTLAPARFWWTRNDRYETRFGWDGTLQRWAPYKGSGVVEVGRLLPDESYRLDPKVTNLPVNAYLPGTSTRDAYAMLRVGTSPGAVESEPVTHVRVRPDREVEDGYDFTLDPTSKAVMGQSNGMLEFNPSFVELHAGKTIWFVYKSFSETADGIVGQLRSADVQPLYLAPIPGPADRPLLRFGNRRYLQPTLVATDSALLSSAAPAEGEVLVSLSTGRLLFSSADLAKADPTSPFFDKHFLGEDVVYDGLALNQTPQPTKEAVPLLDENGVPATTASSAFYIPDEVVLPEEFALSDAFRGLGKSGVLDAPDGTGATPKYPLLDASVRPGGDDAVSQNPGRLRRVDDGVGDMTLFSKKGAVSTVQEVDREDDLPSKPYKVQKGEAYIARERGTYGSRVMLSRDDLRDWAGDDEAIYFIQMTLTPATHTEEARLVSRNRDIFRFEEGQTLYFAIDGTAYEWAAPTALSFYTPEQVAASLDAAITGTGSAYAQNGRVVLEAGTPATGSVEIGWGKLDPISLEPVKDLTGAAVLGFLPGWRAVGGVTNWLPDSGAALGLFRSPVNLNRAAATPDVRATERLEDALLTKSVAGTPYHFLDYPPLQDIAGYGDGVFFGLQTVLDDGQSVQIVNKPLQHYRDIIHRFGQRRFDWVARDTVEEALENTTATLVLGRTAVPPESMLGAPGIGGGLYVAEGGGSTVLQSQETDYVMPQDGASGNILLVARLGSRVTYGARGTYQASGTAFTDADADFSSVLPGYRLKVGSGEALGSYRVTAVTSPTELAVTPPFRSSASSPVVWEVFEGYSRDVYDQSVIADITYKSFNHLQEEPFKVRQLSSVGEVPTSTPATPLRANMEAALASGRIISIRYGLVQAAATNTAALVALTQTALGAIANDALDVPAGTARFSSGSFSVKVGATTYPQGGGLTGVASFSPDPGSGDGIEYLTAASGDDPAGRLKFGSNLLSEFAAANVLYVEEFQPSAGLSSLTVEYRPATGDLNFSSADMAAFAGTAAYFVEQMVTEEQTDVGVSPLLGAVAFKTPVPEGSAVEIEYWEADYEGRKTGGQRIEFLPVFVRDEAAVWVNRTTLTFGSESTTIDQRVAPTAYIGPMMQNFGTTDYLVDYPPELNGKGRLTFISKTIESSLPVTVSYAVFEAQGGEKAYETSRKPVYRPPFFIKEEQHQFGVWGNRVAEFELGQMFRIGGDCFYVTKLTYYPPQGPQTEGITAIGIYPSTTTEVGTRAPGNDVITVVTSEPVATEVTPSGGSPTPTNAPLGFMSAINTADFPFEPVSRGQKTIVFQGDLTAFAQPGHIFELDGSPFTISEVELDPDGRHTKISVTAPFRTGYSVSAAPTVKLSYRPVYPPQTRDFLGAGAVLTDEAYELVLYGETDASGNEMPGRTLSEGIEYSIDPDTGNFQLVSPLQDALGPGQQLYFFFTRIRTLQPFVEDGEVIAPRYTADFLYGDTPSASNGVLGATLTGTYTFRIPDSFYFRSVRLPSFLAEAAQEAVEEITSKQPASGAPQPGGGGSENWEQGRTGLLGERGHLEDKDRAARTFLDFYNQSVEAFEQVLETVSGGFIGDRDGKFRFFVGHDKDWPTPGYEDAISGLLSPRRAWSEVYGSERPDLDLTFLETDWIVSPSSLAISGGAVTGYLPDPDKMREMASQQRALVQNDVDDRVFIQLGERSITRSSTAPYYAYQAKGLYARMADQHRFSRLYPTLTRAFLMTYPGVEADLEENEPGVYTYGRVIDGKRQSTNGETIGQLFNPVLGDLTAVSTAELGRRRARGRVWAYLPAGLPAGAFTVAVPPSAALARPVVIAFPALLRDVPVNPETGYPDNQQLLSQGGEVPDALSGDFELAVPGFEEGQQLRWGRPDGTTYELFYRDGGIDVFGRATYTGVFVKEVLYGCVLTLADADGNDISNAGQVLVGLTPSTGIPLHEFAAEQGDTVYAGAPTGSRSTAFNDPPEFEDFEGMAGGLDLYRPGVDLSIQTDGRIIDRTMPSFGDPYFFGLKELQGQKPPDPLSALEGPVEFVYAEQNPLRVPALDGFTTDDSGDYQIPYMRAGDTELDRFDEITFSFPLVMTTVDGFASQAVYPDEILDNDGEVVTAPPAVDAPAALLTDKDLAPSGVGERLVRPFDVVLIQPDSPSPFGNDGPLGIHTVGAVTDNYPGSSSTIEPPRFVTHTAAGSPIRYTFEDAMVWLDPSGVYPPDPQAQPAPPAGIEILEDVVAGLTVLDFTSVGTFALNNGAPGVGNLNDIFAASAKNHISIKVIARLDLDVGLWPPAPYDPNMPWPNETGGLIALIIHFYDGDVWAADESGNLLLPPVPLGAPVQFGQTYAYPGWAIGMQVIIPAVGWFPWSDLGPSTPLAPPLRNQWFMPYEYGVAGPQVFKTLYGQEFSFDVITYDTTLPTPDGESTTAWIDEDRLTFYEDIDLRLAKERGFTHPIDPAPHPQLVLDAKLVIDEVTVPDPGGGFYWSAVNRYSNGLVVDPTPFTFLARAGVVGDYTPPGSIKVMGFEGHGNTPIIGTGVTFSAMPSNDYMEGSTAAICSGTGFVGSYFNTGLGVNTRRIQDNRVSVVAATTSLERVVAGDVLVIERSADVANPASPYVGTYLVRHAVEPNVGDHYRETNPTAIAGAGNGWCPVEFPRVADFDPNTDTITLDSAPTTEEGPGFDPDGSRRMYVILDLGALGSDQDDDYKYGAVSAIFAATATPEEFTLSSYQDSIGNPLTASAFNSLIAGRALQVAGMTRLPVQMGGSEYGLPSNNCIGYEDFGSWVSPRGVRYATFRSPVVVGGTDQQFDGSVTGLAPPPPDREIGTGADPASPGQLTFYNRPSVAGSHAFLPDVATPVYHNVVDTLDIGDVPSSVWDALNVNAAAPAPSAVPPQCLLPSTVLALEDLAGTTPGYWAQAGIFLEPSFPRSALNLIGAHPRVVDASHTITDPLTAGNDLQRESWMRDTSEYTATAITLPEQVKFHVRRVRRWHSVMDDAGDAFKALRYAYEIRRGRITGYSTNVRQRGVLQATGFTMDWNTDHPHPASPLAPDVWNDGETYTGTNLGPFDDPDVDINAGDRFRLLDDDGTLIEECEILGVEGPGTIKLAMPGITRRTAAQLIADDGMRFEIWLRQVPVPLEQSNEQLLDLISDREVYRTDADWENERGGYVETSTFNTMYDDELAQTGDSFISKGVRVGDIVVIDPAGTLPQWGGLPVIPDRGQRPFGDLGVTSRGTPTVFEGKPGERDDNRGFYRVAQVVPGSPVSLVVDPISTFAGGPTNTDWVTFAEGTSPNREYAVYPTISDSGLTGDFEGQMDLRPTEKRDPVTESYGGNDYSIRPFSYRVIRPSALFSGEAIDLVLFMRERMLSLIEMLRGLLYGWKYGSYFVFQRDEHISDLGLTTDPESGKGVLTNRYIEEIIGELGTVPFLNNRGCLSLLDRRFWIFDLRLDRLTTASDVSMRLSGPGDTPYTAFTDDVSGGSDVRPVLPERVDLVLDESDRFRSIRYVWLAYRVHKILGTLAAIRRYDDELPERLAERERLLLLEETTGAVSD